MDTFLIQDWWSEVNGGRILSKYLPEGGVEPGDVGRGRWKYLRKVGFMSL